MDETQKNRIVRFLQDSVMSDAVYKVLLNSFLKSKSSTDVNYLAASRIAIDLLNESWRELARFNVEEQEGGKGLKQVGM